MSKFIFFLSIILFCSYCIKAQSDTLASKRVYQFVDQMPEYPGGEDSLFQFLATNIIYPTDARQAEIEGRVIAEFIVLANGRLTNFKVKKEIGGGCGDEVLRVLKLMPTWKAGRQNGKEVSVQYILPVKFALDKSKPKPTATPLKPLSLYLNYERTKLVRKHLGVD